MRVALYERRSTDEILQSDSLEAQDDVLRKHASLHEHEVVAVYADSASGRSVAGRDAFQRLVRDVAAGAPFEGVLVRDVSRWGRFQNIDESAYWEFFFLIHGVRVLYVEEQFADDVSPYAALMKALKRASAAEFSREKARLIQFGIYRSVKKGFRHGGNPPFGMHRVLVTPEGVEVQVLRRGQRKLINDHRVKLRPGPRREVRIVQRIFRLFVKGGLSEGAIVAALNRDDVPSPYGRRWQQVTLHKILTNPAYAGYAAGVFRKSDSFPEEVRVLVEGAWPGLVSVDVWQAAQRRLTEYSWRKSPQGLASQIREIFERWGVVIDNPRLLGEHGRPTPETYRRYFEGGDNEAILTAYAAEIEKICAELRDELRKVFDVAVDGDTVVLDSLLRVGFKVAFPRAHRLGRVHWRFVFDGTERQDVTIAIALSPEAKPAVYFRLVNAKMRPKKQAILRSEHSEATRTAARAFDQLARALRLDRLRYSPVARAKFLEAIKDLPVVNTQKVARSLGWPETSGLVVYHNLVRAGTPVPPLAKRPGHRVTFVCASCDAGKEISLSRALARKTDLCIDCLRKSQAKYRTCPDCGDRRRLGSGELKRLANGVNSRCRRCSSRVTLRAVRHTQARGR